jgi:hypothetical protein
MPRQETRASREERRSEVGRRYLKGESQVTIAEAIGYSAAQVSRDLAIMRERWKKSVERSQEELKTEAIARLEEMSRCFWTGWEASLAPRETTTQEKRSGGGEGVRVSVRREVPKGDPRFLDGIARTEERRIKLLGLDAPSRCEVSAVTERTMGPEEVDREIQRLTARVIPPELLDPEAFAPEHMPPGFAPLPPRPPMTPFERLCCLIQAQARQDLQG